MNIYKKNYQKLEQLNAFKQNYLKVKNPGYMDLSMEKTWTVNGCDIISIAHYGVQNGDLMSDPEMELRVNHEMKTVEALTFTNHYIGCYSQVYEDYTDQDSGIDLKQKREQNKFLTMWLNNLVNQGFIEAQEAQEEKEESKKAVKQLEINWLTSARKCLAGVS